MTRLAARPLSLATILLIVATGCGSTNPAPIPSATSAPPSPSPTARLSPAPPTVAPTPLSSAELSALYQTIEGQVVELRDLHPKTAVNPTLLDDAGMKKLTAEGFNRDNPPELIAANQRMYEALGMLPANASLHDLYVELLGSQVVGLYNRDDKHLYVVARNGRIGPAEKVTFSHEFTHALQDRTSTSAR